MQLLEFCFPVDCYGEVIAMNWKVRSAALQNAKVLFPCLAALFLLAAVVPSVAQVANPLPAEIAQHLDQDKFVEFHLSSDFPDSLKAHYLKVTGADDINKVFASAGGKWQAGCVRTAGGPPSRNLLLGAKSKDLCLIYFELGGIALVDTIEIYRLKGKECQRVWSASMFRDHPGTAGELLQAVKQRAKS
jgi:hypothetical protein